MNDIEVAKIALQMLLTQLGGMYSDLYDQFREEFPRESPPPTVEGNLNFHYEAGRLKGYQDIIAKLTEVLRYETPKDDAPHDLKELFN